MTRALIGILVVSVSCTFAGASQPPNSTALGRVPFASFEFGGIDAELPEPFQGPFPVALASLRVALLRICYLRCRFLLQLTPGLR